MIKITFLLNRNRNQISMHLQSCCVLNCFANPMFYMVAISQALGMFPRHVRDREDCGSWILMYSPHATHATLHLCWLTEIWHPSPSPSLISEIFLNTNTDVFWTWGQNSTDKVRTIHSSATPAWLDGAMSLYCHPSIAKHNSFSTRPLDTSY